MEHGLQLFDPAGSGERAEVVDHRDSLVVRPTRGFSAPRQVSTKASRIARGAVPLVAGSSHVIRGIAVLASSS